MRNIIPVYKSLDDLLFATYSSILAEGTLIKSKRNPNLEITNFSATLSKPRARTSMSLDRKLVGSKFAEFAWYLTKDKCLEYITPYISAYHKEEQENHKILGAYGPKIFGSIKSQKSQFERVIEQVSLRNSTKQAYISLSDIDDYKVRDDKYSSPPCTLGLHFYVRAGFLNLTTYMRSNDAYFGLPHDLFCFTMLQDLVACRTNIPIGIYTHIATSMHIYEDKIQGVKQYLEEGYHEPIEMPPIRICSDITLDIISKEFDTKCSETQFNELDDYWKEYVLFSKRQFNPSQPEEWKDKFKNTSMRLIAANTLAK